MARLSSRHREKTIAMRTRSERGWFKVACTMPLLLGLAILGCQTIRNVLSGRLTHWDMLGEEAVEDPIQAVGGDGMVFVPSQDDAALSRQQLAGASPETLVRYYAPVFVQQRVSTGAMKYPYPPEFDLIGEARLRREANGKLKSYVSGSSKVYVIFKKLPIEGHEHVQITYTAWYPAHPRMTAIDLEEADIDSCVVRATLDSDNAPLFYETIAACGCFHKVFVAKRLEDMARQTYGAPLKGMKYCVEQTVSDAVEWEVGGVFDEPREQPRRPVVFLKAGEHKVIGLVSAARLRVRPTTEKHVYETTSYADLYTVTVDGTAEQAGFFDMGNGGKVRGGERRKEKFFLSILGVDDAGHPRADDQIKMHFDESSWDDPTSYRKFLRLPPGTL
jgi:hypothetical protein